jgi:hypothetical protein
VWLLGALLGCVALVLLYRAILRRRATRRARDAGGPS